MVCLYSAARASPAATVQHRLEVFQGVDVLHARLTLDPAFVDNTYGANAIGWSSAKKGTHSYKDLVGSDHAELSLMDAQGALRLQFKADYLSADAAAPSGYRSLGVKGGDGTMQVGDPAAVVAFSSSMDKNLNERGYSGFVVDSPATDSAYTPNPSTPNWDYRVVYEVWVRKDAMGPGGFGSARLSFIHASPSKTSTNTEDVTPKDCPDDWGGPGAEPTTPIN